MQLLLTEISLAAFPLTGGQQKPPREGLLREGQMTHLPCKSGAEPEVPVRGDGFVGVFARDNADAMGVELLLAPVLLAHDARADQRHGAIAVGGAHAVADLTAVAGAARILVHLPTHLVLLVRLALLLRLLHCLPSHTQNGLFAGTRVRTGYLAHVPECRLA